MTVHRWQLEQNETGKLLLKKWNYIRPNLY